MIPPAELPPASTKNERRLETLGRKAAEGVEFARQRDELALAMWQDGMSIPEIAARLDRADKRGGGEGVTHHAVQKRLYRLRRNDDAC